MEYSWIGILSAKDKAINWKALELPLASQIKGLAILQEEGGEVSRCMSGFWMILDSETDLGSFAHLSYLAYVFMAGRCI